MFKTKLQEYCQSKTWNLPEYNTTREGPDHCAQFKAVVDVNGLSFVSQQPCKSSKAAQNEAAKLAFNHFTAGSSVATVGFPTPHASSGIVETRKDVSETTPSTEINIKAKDYESPAGVSASVDLPKRSSSSKEPNVPNAASSSELPSTIKDDLRPEDIPHFCKKQLQEYAQKKGIPLPIFSSIREGPPHACRFKCEVIVEGKTFGSPDSFPRLRDAENAAARVAFLSLSAYEVEQVGPSFCKNLLQEYLQKTYSCLPVYNTSQTGGPSHAPSFVSAVEIRGETFQGEEAKTKKLAEICAAKVAYTVLKKREGKSSAGEETICSIKSGSDNQPTDLEGNREWTQDLCVAGEALQVPQSPVAVSNGVIKEGSPPSPPKLPGATTTRYPNSSGTLTTVIEYPDSFLDPAASSVNLIRKVTCYPRTEEVVTVPPGSRFLCADERRVVIESYVVKEERNAD